MLRQVCYFCWVNMLGLQKKGKRDNVFKRSHARDPNVQIFAGPHDSFSDMWFCSVYGVLSRVKGFITQQGAMNSLVDAVGKTGLLGKHLSVRSRSPRVRKHLYSVIEIT